MRVVHCECGLGNQMCYYAKYLALRHMHPNEDVYMETFLYDVPGIESHMNMWNGYELEKVFGIKTNNVTEIIKTPYQEIGNIIAKSEFWNTRWAASAQIITKILADEGIISRQNIDTQNYKISSLKNLYMKYRNSLFCYVIRNIYWHVKGKDNPQNYALATCFEKNDDREYYTDLFDIIKPNSGLNQIRSELINSFVFPELSSKRNLDILKIIKETNSVSIHVRKSDCFKYNADCFKFGYFKRCVSYIRSKVSTPIFFVFSDDPSWVNNNLRTLGLNIKDQVYYINWNSGADSYIDLQLMSNCKHNISTNSTFGFWASFLNQNETKITCAPKGSFDVTNWF